MLQRVAELPIDDTALDHFELNGTARRKLHTDLREIDLRLQRWAAWAKPRYGQLGYPTRSITERANEGGILAKDFSPPYSPEWPAEVAALDVHVARLPTRHLAAVMATYFHLALPSEERAQVYARLVPFLARTRPRGGVVPGRKRAGQAGDSAGRGAFQQDLTIARWTLRYALRA